MEAVISESLFEKQKSSFDMLNRNWVFILLFSNIILSLLISIIIIIIIWTVTWRQGPMILSQSVRLSVRLSLT